MADLRSKEHSAQDAQVKIPEKFDDLIAKADAGLRGQGAIIEAMQHLHEQQNGTSRLTGETLKFTKWIFWLTLFIFLVTIPTSFVILYQFFNPPH